MKKTMSESHFNLLLQSIQDLDAEVERGENPATLMATCIDVAFFGVLGVGEILSGEQQLEWDKAAGVMAVLRLKEFLMRGGRK